MIVLPPYLSRDSMRLRGEITQSGREAVPEGGRTGVRLARGRLLVFEGVDGQNAPGGQALGHPGSYQ